MSSPLDTWEHFFVFLGSLGLSFPLHLALDISRTGQPVQSQVAQREGEEGCHSNGCERPRWPRPTTEENGRRFWDEMIDSQATPFSVAAVQVSILTLCTTSPPMRPQGHHDTATTFARFPLERTRTFAWPSSAVWHGSHSRRWEGPPRCRYTRVLKRLSVGVFSGTPLLARTRASSLCRAQRVAAKRFPYEHALGFALALEDISAETPSWTTPGIQKRVTSARLFWRMQTSPEGSER